MQEFVERPTWRARQRQTGRERHAHWVLLTQRSRALRRMGFKTYDEYLASPYWLAFRQRLLSERGACDDCGTRQSLQLHHLSYARLGAEVAADVRVLCQPCHEKVHGRKFKGRAAAAGRDCAADANQASAKNTYNGQG
jgi:hypothetical protein